METNKKKLKENYKNRASIGGVYKMTCNANGATWLRGTTDLRGAKNRFEFATKTNLSPETALNDAWKTYGAGAFSFEILEEIEQGEVQTNKEFSEDVKTLLEMYSERQGN